MEFEEVLEQHVGQFGRFQLFILLFVSIEELFMAFNILSPVFLVGKPEYHCQIPMINNNTNCTTEELIQLKIPRDGYDHASSCQTIDWNNTHMRGQDADLCSVGLNTSLVQDMGTVGECKAWVYDETVFGKTMVTEWDLVCGQQYQAASFAAVYMAGWIVGSSLLGMAADWWGRKPVIIATGVVYVAAGVGIALVPSYLVALVLRFFQSCFGSIKTNAALILVTEYVGPDWRVAVTVCYYLYWVAGYVFLAGIAYLIRDWRTLQLAITTPEILFFIIFACMVPESPRWLVAKNRRNEADEVLEKMARWNRTNYPHDLDIRYSVNKVKTAWHLLRTPSIRKLTLNIFLAWVANSFVYYGLSLNTSNLGGNPYINFLIAGAVELPAYLLLIPMFKYCGRVITYLVLMLLAGLSLVTVIAIPEDLTWVIVTVSMVGKFCISCTFTGICIYTTEVYPTEIRCAATSYASLIGRFGALLASYVEVLGTIHRSLPLVVFGAVSVLSGLMAFALPETRGTPMLQTVAQGEIFVKERAGKLCCVRRNEDDVTQLESSDLASSIKA